MTVHSELKFTHGKETGSIARTELILYHNILSLSIDISKIFLFNDFFTYYTQILFVRQKSGKEYQMHVEFLGVI